MACGAIKRSLEWDPLNTPSQSSTPSARPSKKRCLVHHNYNPNGFSGPKEASPFADLHGKLSPETIASNIKDEMKRLQNRKQLYYSNSGNQLMSSPNSESNSNENEASTSSEGQSFLGLRSPSRRDQPLFTFRQVTIICERLLKERETSIREEYDRVLSSKLAEQYDTFVKFTYDQIQKRFENGTTPSYVN
ncbi:akirin-2 isoform X1 [Tetranychus urticae]|uniref:Akirin n=1 Tax=Tetranychus urticae TaxID=32264 RepID=T1JPZ5_TETUR|nr:akirin-2 isoform X1 [Tetranychus urticae]